MLWPIVQEAKSFHPSFKIVITGNDIIDAIRSCFRKYDMPFFLITMIGHSLGAGIAGLMTLLLKQETPSLEVEAYCFGCPGIVSRETSLRVSLWVYPSLWHIVDIEDVFSWLLAMKRKFLVLTTHRSDVIGNWFHS